MGFEKVDRMETSVQKKFFSLDPGERDNIYLVTPFHDPFVVSKHNVGASAVLCPGKDKCPACQQGEKPDEYFCFTIFSEKYGRMIASWKFTKKGILKRLHKRFKSLNPEGTTPEQVKSMKGDVFAVERDSGGFAYEVDFVENRIDQVEGMQEFTPAEIIARMKGGND